MVLGSSERPPGSDLVTSGIHNLPGRGLAALPISAAWLGFPRAHLPLRGLWDPYRPWTPGGCVRSPSLSSTLTPPLPARLSLDCIWLIRLALSSAQCSFHIHCPVGGSVAEHI